MRQTQWLVEKYGFYILTSDPLGKLIFSESYKEFTKFMNEEVEFKEIKPWMK